MKKICVICGKEFETKRKDILTCSQECKELRRKEIVKQYYNNNRDKFLKVKKKYDTDFELKRKKVVQAEFDHTIKARKDDPVWIKDYAKGDRMTKISMLARKLTDFNIRQINYGELSTLWNTIKYIDWEHQVLGILRSKEKKDGKLNAQTKNTT